MRELSLVCKLTPKKKKNSALYGPESKAAPNLLNREFDAPMPNMKWATDITVFSMPTCKLYLSTIMDLATRKIIAFEIGKHQDLGLVIDTLNSAVHDVDFGGTLMLHSYQGSQYTSEIFKQALNEHGIVQSMSRRATCLDNAVMENFFSLLKKELDYKKITKFDDLKGAIEEYIDYYNNERIKLKFKMGPADYERRLLSEE